MDKLYFYITLLLAGIMPILFGDDIGWIILGLLASFMVYELINKIINTFN